MSYAHIAKSANPEADAGGYKNVVYLSKISEFQTLSGTVTPVVEPADALTIAAVHAFAAGKGFLEWACRTNSVTVKSTTTGDEGAQILEHTCEFEVLGDSASTQAQMQNLINDDVIFLLKDAQCAAGQYIQLGNDCKPPVAKVEFDGKTTKEGKKIYKVSIVTTGKYFYNYAVPKKA